MDLRKETERFLTVHGILPPDGGDTTIHMVCACSGGADSTALLHLLRQAPGVAVIGAHFNHCLRGAESDRDEDFVRAFCAELGVRFRAGRGDVAAYAAAHGLGTEEAARALRYEFLTRAAAETGCAYIATAHTADDNAETVLMRLVRGAGTRGLCGIPPVRDAGDGIRIVRPLLGVTRAEIEAYLSANGLSHVEDSSNESDEYTRNRLRHTVLPALRQLNPAAIKNICSAAELLREDEAYLDGCAERFILERYRDGALPVPALLELPEPVAMRVLRTLCGSPGRGHLAAVYALCSSAAPRGAADIPGMRVTRVGGTLYFGNAPASAPVATITRREIRPGETILLPEIGKCVRCTETVFFGGKEIYSSFNTFYFQSEKICGKINVGSRAPGDKIRLYGRGCTKSLRKLFAEAGIPPAERARTPVFSDEAGVIAAAGFGIAERCAPVKGARALKIELIPIGVSDHGKKETEETGQDKEGEAMSENMRDDLLQVLFTEEQLRARVRELGEQITEDYRGRHPLFLGVLKGCFVFMSDLIRNVDLQAGLDFMAVSSYGAGTSTTGAVRITKDLSRDIEGLDVVIVEDILDSGVTLNYLREYLSNRRPASIKIVTLLDKPSRRRADVRPDYCGFTVPDEFVVGYGLDYAEHYRNLPYIGVLKPEIYTN